MNHSTRFSHLNVCSKSGYCFVFIAYAAISIHTFVSDDSSLYTLDILDTLVMPRVKTHYEAAILIMSEVSQVIDRIRRLELEVSPQKSVALCFHGPWSRPPSGSKIIVGGVPISIESKLRYLGLILDSR